MHAFATLFVLFLSPFAANAAAIAEGERAPPFEARLFDGTHFRCQTSRQGRRDQFLGDVVRTVPRGDARAGRVLPLHRDEGLEIVAISMDNPKDEAKARAMMQAYSFPAAFVRETSCKGYGSIWRLPLTFVIDRQGILRKDGWYGDPLLDTATLEQTVTPLLRARDECGVADRARIRRASLPVFTSCSRPRGDRVPRLDLPAVDALVDRHLRIDVGVQVVHDLEIHAGTQVHERCAAVVDVRVRARFAAFDARVDLDATE